MLHAANLKTTPRAAWSSFDGLKRFDLTPEMMA
jgi:hypothetical protein